MLFSTDGDQSGDFFALHVSRLVVSTLRQACRRVGILNGTIVWATCLLLVLLPTYY